MTAHTWLGPTTIDIGAVKSKEQAHDMHARPTIITTIIFNGEQVADPKELKACLVFMITMITSLSPCNYMVILGESNVEFKVPLLHTVRRGAINPSWQP